MATRSLISSFTHLLTLRFTFHPNINPLLTLVKHSTAILGETVKVERYQQTLKGEINQVPYEMPLELRQAIESFAEYYNHRRYHKALANVTPADVSFDRKDGILARASTFSPSIFPMIKNEVRSVGTARLIN